MNKKINIITLLLLSTAFACQTDGIVYYKVANIEGESWDWNDAKIFEFENKDSTHTLNLDAQLRINNNYAYSNIWIKYVLIGNNMRDTNQFSIQLAEEQFGNWLGKGGGSVLQYTKPIFKNKKLPTGKYMMVVSQNMRVKKINNVLDFGLKIKQGEASF